MEFVKLYKVNQEAVKKAMRMWSFATDSLIDLVIMNITKYSSFEQYESFIPV